MTSTISSGRASRVQSSNDVSSSLSRQHSAMLHREQNDTWRKWSLPTSHTSAHIFSNPSAQSKKAFLTHKSSTSKFAKSILLSQTPSIGHVSLLQLTGNEKSKSANASSKSVWIPSTSSEWPQATSIPSQSTPVPHSVKFHSVWWVMSQSQSISDTKSYISGKKFWHVSNPLLSSPAQHWRNLHESHAISTKEPKNFDSPIFPQTSSQEDMTGRQPKSQASSSALLILRSLLSIGSLEVHSSLFVHVPGQSKSKFPIKPPQLEVPDAVSVPPKPRLTPESAFASGPSPKFQLLSEIKESIISGNSPKSQSFLDATESTTSDNPPNSQSPSPSPSNKLLRFQSLIPLRSSNSPRSRCCFWCSFPSDAEADEVSVARFSKARSPATDVGRDLSFVWLELDFAMVSAAVVVDARDTSKMPAAENNFIAITGGR